MVEMVTAVGTKKGRKKPRECRVIESKRKNIVLFEESGKLCQMLRQVKCCGGRKCKFSVMETLLNKYGGVERMARAAE